MYQLGVQSARPSRSFLWNQFRPIFYYLPALFLNSWSITKSILYFDTERVCSDIYVSSFAWLLGLLSFYGGSDSTLSAIAKLKSLRMVFWKEIHVITIVIKLWSFKVYRFNLINTKCSLYNTQSISQLTV